MKNIFNKTNAPYLVAGALATLALVSSGVFAVAPYIGFLAPVAALSVGLPFIIGGAVFSAVAIALSAVVISKNNTISEKDAVVQAQKQTISESEAKIQAQEQTISGQNDQLSEKVKEISGKDAKLVDQAKEIEGKDKIISERDTKIEKDAQKVTMVNSTLQLANFAVSLTKEAANGTWDLSKYVWNNYVPSTESTKGTLSGIGGGLKNTYDASIASVRGALNSVGSSLYSRFHGTKVSSKEKFESRVVQRKQEEANAIEELKNSGSLPDVIELQYKISSPEEQFERKDGSKPSMQELACLGYLDLKIPLASKGNKLII